jgi:putative zinc finger/helix-turn-helix YgiT family protein
MNNKSKSEKCAVCALGTAHEEKTTRRKRLLGHNVTFQRVEYVCDRCKQAYTNEMQGVANNQAERAANQRALHHIGAHELKAMRKNAGTTQAELESVLGLGKNTVARWETGQRAIPPYIQAAIRLFAIS